MERSSPYPQDSDTNLPRNGSYGMSNYTAVDTGHKTNYLDSRPRSYGGAEHYASNSYPTQSYHYQSYPANYSSDGIRSQFDAIPYTESLSALERQDYYRARQTDPSHSYAPYDYASHSYASHIRSPYQEDTASYRAAREQFFEAESKNLIPLESKSGFPMYEGESRLVFSDRAYSTTPGIMSEYDPKPLSSGLDSSVESLRNPGIHPGAITTTSPRDSLEKQLIHETQEIKKSPPESLLDPNPPSRVRESTLTNCPPSSVDTDPLDLRKTENWNEPLQYSAGAPDIRSVPLKHTEIIHESLLDKIESYSQVQDASPPAERDLDLKDQSEKIPENLPTNLQHNELETEILAKSNATNSNLTNDKIKTSSPVLTPVIDKDDWPKISETEDSKNDVVSEAKNQDVLEKKEDVKTNVMEEDDDEKVENDDEIIQKVDKDLDEKKDNLKVKLPETDEVKELNKIEEAKPVPSSEARKRSRRKPKKPLHDVSSTREKTNEDGDSQTFHCGYCGEVFHDKDLLVDHDCEENDAPEVQLKKTPNHKKKQTAAVDEANIRRSARKNKSQAHIKEYSEEEEEGDPYICGECGQTFEKERILLRHIKTHRSSDLEDYVDGEVTPVTRHSSRKKFRPRPKRNAAKRKSYDFTTEEYYSGGAEYKTKKKKEAIIVKEEAVEVPKDTRKYGCAICGEICIGRDTIAQHLIEHCTEVSEDTKIWVCDYCDKQFSDENFLDPHVEVHELNGDQKIVRIKIELKPEPPKKKEKVENKEKKEKKYQCSVCNKTFKLKTFLKMHEKEHNEPRKYLCVVCGEETTGKMAYLAHKKTHKTAKVFSCEECGKIFNYRSGLNQHMKTHAGLLQTFDCEQCNRQFFSAGHLAIHKKGHKHAGTKKHRCQECGYQVYDEAKLFEHLETHINQDPFMCPFCGRLFMKKSTFTKHKKKHSGQNMCDVCGKSFSHKSGLDRHYTTHSGEKAYKCLYCDKSFSQQSNLSTHMRQHSGEKPFMCEICAHSFTNKCSLIRHMSKHTEGESEQVVANMARQGAINNLGNINIPLPPLPAGISHSMYPSLNQYQY